MSKEEIRVTMVIKVENGCPMNCSISASVSNEKCNDIKTILLLDKLKEITGQHIQPLIYSSYELAKLNYEFISNTGIHH